MDQPNNSNILIEKILGILNLQQKTISTMDNTDNKIINLIIYLYKFIFLIFFFILIILTIITLPYLNQLLNFVWWKNLSEGYKILILTIPIGILINVISNILIKKLTK